MEWTDESITRLRSLWQEGLSTAEIGRRMQITKNAVVGKAHRLDLTARPSPIRKVEGQAGAAAAPRRAPAPRSSVVAERSRTMTIGASPASRPTSQAAAPAQSGGQAHAQAQPPKSVSTLSVLDNVRLLRPDMPNPVVARPAAPARQERGDSAGPQVQASANPAPRRRGLTCCWPLGEPGTKDFHFCGGEPTPGKPYCAEHASLAYVKLRDRRDSVA